MRQTAVEWFQSQIIKIVEGTCELSEIEIFTQAKAMEKEQRIQDYSVGYSNGQVDSNRTAEQYYNETFKSE